MVGIFSKKVASWGQKSRQKDFERVKRQRVYTFFLKVLLKSRLVKMTAGERNKSPKIIYFKD